MNVELTSLKPLHETVIPKGNILYHGTHTTLPSHFPSKKANWFSTDHEQAKLWATHIEQYRRHHPWVPANIFLYTYEVVQDIPDIVVMRHCGDFARLSKKWHMNISVNEYIVPINPSGYKVCDVTPYNGWTYMNLQKQVMLCQPVVNTDYLHPIEMQTLKMTPDLLKRYMYQNILREQRNLGNKDIQIQLDDIERELDAIQQDKWAPMRGGGMITGHDKRPYHHRSLYKKDL